MGRWAASLILFPQHLCSVTEMMWRRKISHCGHLAQVKVVRTLDLDDRKHDYQPEL